MQSRQRGVRTSRRYPRRFKVTFLQSTSYTSNVGAGGFGTERLRIAAPATPVQGTIVVGERVFTFSGRVAWTKPGDLNLNLRGRMGVEFVHIDPRFDTLIASEAARASDRTLRPQRAAG